jgi:hypothetical protein
MRRFPFCFFGPDTFVFPPEDKNSFAFRAVPTAKAFSSPNSFPAVNSRPSLVLLNRAETRVFRAFRKYFFNSLSYYAKTCIFANS